MRRKKQVRALYHNELKLLSVLYMLLTITDHNRICIKPIIREIERYTIDFIINLTFTNFHMFYGTIQDL